MIPSLSQETITEYASEAQTIQEPTGTDYTQGVRVGKTIPAKWWNWLFKGATRRLGQAKTDAQNMLTELQNVVTDAGITLDGSDNTQLAQATRSEADKQIDNYILTKKISFTGIWYALRAFLNGVECTGNCGRVTTYMFKIGNKIALYTNQFSVGLTNEGTAYTFDLIHWFKAGSGVSGIAVITNGYWYSLGGGTSNTELHKNSLDGLRTRGTSIFDEHDIGSNGYTPFITCINDIVYVFTHRGKIYRINADDTYTELSTATGAGQIQVTTYTTAKVVEPVVINGRIFVGNLEFSGGTFTPVFNATNASENAGCVKVKKLHNGNVLFCCADSYASAYGLKVLDSQGVIHNVEGSFSSAIIDKNTAANDLAIRYYNEQYQFSYDGINFVPLALSSSSYNNVNVLQLRNRYFILVRYPNSTFDHLYYTDDISGDVSELMQGRNGSLYSTRIKDDCIVFSATSSDYSSLDYLVSYDLETELFNTKAVQLDGTVINIDYREPRITTDTEAFVSRYGTPSGDFASYNQINRVVGNTLYLR